MNTERKCNPEEDLTRVLRMQCHCKQLYPDARQCPFFRAACPHYLPVMAHEQFREHVARQNAAH